MSEEGNGKVDLAILKTLLTGVKERLAELQKSQAEFLRDWPNHVSKIVGLEGRIAALEEKVEGHKSGDSIKTANLLALLSVICMLGMFLWDVFGK